MSLLRKIEQIYSSLRQSPSPAPAREETRRPQEPQPTIAYVDDHETPTFAFLSSSTETDGTECDAKPDNFLRGQLMSGRRRRRTTEIDRMAITYWRHGSGCPCCRESNRLGSFAPPSTQPPGQFASDAARSNYLNLSNGMGLEMSCLSSFITNSGQFRGRNPAESVSPAGEDCQEQPTKFVNPEVNIVDLRSETVEERNESKQIDEALLLYDDDSRNAAMVVASSSKQPSGNLLSKLIDQRRVSHRESDARRDLKTT